jgi:hypothetical protein
MKHLFKAIADFQQEVPVIHKGTQGYGYSYSDLPAIFKVINPLLQKHGLGFIQSINSHEGDNYLNTIVFHSESAEKIESSTLIPNVALKGMNDYQSFGSGITYYRRYALASMLGLVTDKDTDASGEQVKHEPKKQPINDERFVKALQAIKEGKAKKDDLLKFELTPEQKAML